MYTLYKKYIRRTSIEHVDHVADFDRCLRKEKYTHIFNHTKKLIRIVIIVRKLVRNGAI